MADDNNNDGVTIDIEQLSNSFKGKVNSLHPLIEDCCIYRVPPKIRMLKRSFYTPKMVSIGPLHHGRRELKAMEEYKLRYLELFLLRTRKSTNDFLRLVKANEGKLRSCYAETTTKFKSRDFVEMIFLDAVFLIGILLQYIPEFQSRDRIFSKPGMIKDIVLDIMLLENQLPIFILEDLFNLAELKTVLVRERRTLTERHLPHPDASVPYSLRQLTSKFFRSYICPDFFIEDALLELHFPQATHFVDLLRLCLKPPDPPHDPPNPPNDPPDPPHDPPDPPNDPPDPPHDPPDPPHDPPNPPNTSWQAVVDWLRRCLKTPNPPNTTSMQADSEAAPSVTTLHKAGIKFVVPQPVNCLLSIKFENGTLRIPKLTIGGTTVHLLRNLQIYETLHSDDTNYINDYDMVLKCLLSTSDDVEILIQNGVIESMILDSHGVSTVFQELSRDGRVQNDNFYYSPLVKDLKKYCKSRRHNWYASLMQDYCHNPWAITALIVGSLILALTAIQVACAFTKCQK